MGWTMLRTYRSYPSVWLHSYLREAEGAPAMFSSSLRCQMLQMKLQLSWLLTQHWPSPWELYTFLLPRTLKQFSQGFLTPFWALPAQGPLAGRRGAQGREACGSGGGRRGEGPCCSLAGAIRHSFQGHTKG